MKTFIKTTLVACLLLGILASCAGGGLISRPDKDGQSGGKVVGVWATVLEF